MMRTVRFIGLVALAGITSITFAQGTSSTSSTAQSPASTLSTMEIDIIFPIQNATYNITESLPIVFALQNLTAAAAFGPFTFVWDIMPWGEVGEPPAPGGVTNDRWKAIFTTANASSEPYILVNQTNVQQWQFGPHYYHGSVYALQWYLSWDSHGPCDSDPYGPRGTHLFNINIDSPEPNLEDLIGQCSQLGGAYDINTAAKNSSCSAVVSSSSSGDPCAVTLDQARVGNISSAVKSLIAASAAASSASSVPATATPTSTLSPARHNVAVHSSVPSLDVLVVALLASLQMAMSL